MGSQHFLIIPVPAERSTSDCCRCNYSDFSKGDKSRYRSKTAGCKHHSTCKKHNCCESVLTDTRCVEGVDCDLMSCEHKNVIAYTKLSLESSCLMLHFTCISKRLLLVEIF